MKRYCDDCCPSLSCLVTLDIFLDLEGVLMNDFRWSFKRHFIVSVCVTGITVFSDFLTGGFLAHLFVLSSRVLGSMKMNGSASTAIIGGADGPTTIFLSGNPLTLLIVSKIVLLLLLLILFIPTKKIIIKSQK